MSEIVDIEQVGWEPVRPEITRDVYGKTLMDQGVKAVLTRVAPGGRFSAHRDRYGHLFYFISGEGAGRVGEKEFKVQPGLVVRVQAGETHSYENTGTADLMLISLNIA